MLYGARINSILAMTFPVTDATRIYHPFRIVTLNITLELCLLMLNVFTIKAQCPRNSHMYGSFQSDLHPHYSTWLYPLHTNVLNIIATTRDGWFAVSLMRQSSIISYYKTDLTPNLQESRHDRADARSTRRLQTSEHTTRSQFQKKLISYCVHENVVLLNTSRVWECNKKSFLSLNTSY